MGGWEDRRTIRPLENQLSLVLLRPLKSPPPVKTTFGGGPPQELDVGARRAPYIWLKHTENQSHLSNPDVQGRKRGRGNTTGLLEIG
jgi:hypothetical protein